MYPSIKYQHISINSISSSTEVKVLSSVYINILWKKLKNVLWTVNIPMWSMVKKLKSKPISDWGSLNIFSWKISSSAGWNMLLLT